MGLFKRIAGQAKAAAELAADIRSQMPNPADAPSMGAGRTPEFHIINPTPQDEVDRLRKAGGIVRGVVMGSHHEMENGSRSFRTRVHVRVCSRLDEGALGDEVKLTAWVNWKVAVLLEPGLEIPIAVDANTGRPLEIAKDDLHRELEPRFDEAAKRQKGWDVDLGLEGITDLPGAVKDAFSTPSETMPDDGGLAPSDPLLEPINGVTLERLIAVQAHLMTGVPPTDYDAVAQTHGVPAGMWAETEQAWNMRIWTSPPLAQRWGVALERAKESAGANG